MNHGLKDKDLIGIPWRVALALQADGWYLRSDIIWHKPNPMPESVTDRPTKAHEYIFLLTKSQRYYYDAEAVKEPSSGQSGSAANFQRNSKEQKVPGQRNLQHRMERTPTVDTGTRNKRSVWTVATASYAGAHFATFPLALIEPCILAGTSEKGCCSACGAPWERVVERGELIQAHWAPGTQKKANIANGKHGASSVINTGMIATRRSTGWQPTCDCNAEVVPSTVLDPFSGSGTTGAVACAHGRNYIGIELNPEYIGLAHKRIREAINESGRARIQPEYAESDFADMPLFS